MMPLHYVRSCFCWGWGARRPLTTSQHKARSTQLVVYFSKDCLHAAPGAPQRPESRSRGGTRSSGITPAPNANNAKQSAASRACRSARCMACRTMQMTPAGLEPAIPGSVGRCLIHWATGPCALCDPAWALLWRDEFCEHIPRNLCWSYFCTRLGRRLAESIAPLSAPPPTKHGGQPR
jgi:hypothetical protein